jgi:hypothetical protein
VITSPPQAAVSPRCKRGRETYRHQRNTYQFDVDQAQAVTADGRAPVEVAPVSVQACVADCRDGAPDRVHIRPTA